MQLIQRLLVVTASMLAISSCGGSGGGGDSQEPASDNTTLPVITQVPSDQPESPIVAPPEPPFVLPNDAASLENALITRYVSADDFDVWQCQSDGSSVPELAYALPLPGTIGDGRIGREYALSTGGESLFAWQALSATQLRTTVLDTSMITDTSNYQFMGRDSFSFELSSTRLNCNRVSNTVAFGGEIPPTDNNTGSTISLADENARIPASNRPTMASSVSTFDPIFFTNEADMVMTFPNGLITSCVDWDLVNGQPRDCGSNFDIAEVSNLRQFSPGETVNNTFGRLNSNGSSPNALIMLANGEIAIGNAVSSIFGIDSDPDEFTTGRYYLNGYTITLELGGNIFHSFAGTDEDEGDVTSLFLANRFYSVSFQ